MNKPLKRKKIFYVPGMISLVFIPLFCFYHFYRVDAFKVYHSIELVIPVGNEFEEYKIPSLRRYRVFNFNGSHSEKKKLREMKLYLRKLRIEKDTVNGIKIHFGSKSPYQTFITSLDILVEEKAPTWITNKNDIYVLGSSNTYKKVKDTIGHHTMNCGTGALMREEGLRMQEYKREEEIRNFQISYVKQKWKLLSIGYFGLVFLNIFALVKFNKNK
jgi:hypothetical protein